MPNWYNLDNSMKGGLDNLTAPLQNLVVRVFC